MTLKAKKIWTHVGIVALFLAISCVYFSPALSGKVIVQGDAQKGDAMAYEQRQVGEQMGSIPNWNGSMFGGMPGYQTAVDPQHSIFTPLKSILIMRPLGVERNIGMLFLYLIGFYVALLAFGASPWLALVGALAFSLGSYNLIIIEAGHIVKGWAMAMIAPIFGGMVLCLRGATETGTDRRKKMVWGVILFTLALGLQITFNHIQITFYTMLGALLLGLTYLVYALKDKRFKQFALGVAILIVGCGLAFAANVRHLLVNNEYAKYTMRGGSEITVTPEDLYHDGEAKSIASTTNGLDIDYAYSWSYGIDETYTLLVPGAMGGGSGEKVSEDSEFYKNFRQNQAPLYWGDQPFTSGPVYFGAIVIFLFVLGLLVVKGPERWWLLLATILAVIMSWGRHFMGFNEWIFYNLPLYNKFRTPSMSLVLANVAAVILGVLALKEVFEKVKEGQGAQLNKKLYIAGGVTAGMLLIGLLTAGGKAYTGVSDTQMAGQYGNQWQYIQDILMKDRKALFVADSWRSLIFVVLAFATLWLYANNKLKKAVVPVAALAVLTVFDLWGVDRRYLNDDNFVEPRRLALTPSQDDMLIDQNAAQYGDQNYRVFNLACNTFNDSYPSAFHHQIGGYSAAKLRRYQDLIDFYLSRHINTNVLNMLNTRYFVVPGQQGNDVQRNVAALGNAWFVDSCHWVEDANAEILALNDFDPARTAIVDQRWKEQTGKLVLTHDSASRIEWETQQVYTPDYIKYNAHCAKDELAVFSEIYYKPDWFAYIDGKPAEYFRANYVLRAMVIPAGDHVIEFKNEAPTLHKLDTYTLIGSIVLTLAIAGALVWCYRKRENAEAAE